MKQKTRDELEAEAITLRKQTQKLTKEWREENKILQLLIAAGFVTKEKVEEARTLLQP